MRDLANQNFASGKLPTRSTAIIRVLIVLLVIGGVSYLVRGKFNFGDGASSSVVLQEAPRSLTPVDIDTGQNVTEGGVDLTTQSATLTDIRYGGGAKATAVRSFGGGVYILSIDATLPDPKGNSYAVWLVGDEGPILVDYMGGTKNSWSLRLRGPDRYSGMSGIWITLERTKEDVEPEERILEGSF